MTFAAFEIETVGPSVVVVTAEEPSEAPTFGSLAFDSLPGVADPLDGVAGAPLGGDTSSAAELGGTRAADGGTDPTDADAEALLAGADGTDGDCVAGLCAGAVEVTDDGSEDGGATTRGAGDSTFVTGGATVVVGDAGATAVTTGAVVACVTGGAGGATGGAGGSTACCVCGGDSMIGAAGRGAGAFGGRASCGGASTTSGACTFGSGAGAAVVVTI
jgi:hypothetical protein